MTAVDRYSLGAAPAGEPCAQVASDEDQAKAECGECNAAIRIVCGDPPDGARLRGPQPRDFSLDWEVVFPPSQAVSRHGRPTRQAVWEWRAGSGI